MRLYEKHRPATLADIVGQDKAVAQLRGIIDRGGFGGRAVWVSGGSGTGKTSLARIIARTLADAFATVEYDSADQLTQAELEALAEHSQMFALGMGGRAVSIRVKVTQLPCAFSRQTCRAVVQRLNPLCRAF